MSELSKQRSEDFLKISGQFKLGALVTESSHPVTANLSEVAKEDIAAALAQLFQVDEDVLKKFQEFAASGRAHRIAATLLAALKNGGRIFFTGCGSTGRLSILLDSVWRDFWKQQKNPDFENRTFSVMAGGDYALIKIRRRALRILPTFGRKADRGLGRVRRKILFLRSRKAARRPSSLARFGRVWKAGAKVYFVYNNPDDMCLCATRRAQPRGHSRFDRIEKINLTTGPMAITGSTRMQATSIQLCGDADGFGNGRARTAPALEFQSACRWSSQI